MQNQNDKMFNGAMDNLKLSSKPMFTQKEVRAIKPRNKMSFKAKLKLAAVCLIVLVLVFYWVVYSVNKFFNEHELKFQSPVQKPIWIEKRMPVSQHVVVPQAEAKEVPKRYADEWDQYTYEKFSAIHEGDLAVRIARAENGTGQCDRDVNEPDGSSSYGRFMINSTHLKRFKLADVLDCRKNIDIAYQLRMEQGHWKAWSVFKNGSYKLVDLIKYLN